MCCFSRNNFSEFFFPFQLSARFPGMFFFFFLCLSGLSDKNWSCCFSAFPNSQSWFHLLQQCSDTPLCAVLYLVKRRVGCCPLFWPGHAHCSRAVNYSALLKNGRDGNSENGLEFQNSCLSSDLDNVGESRRCCLGCSFCRRTGGADGEEQDREMLLGGTGAALLEFIVPLEGSRH